MSKRMMWRILSTLVCIFLFMAIATAHEVVISEQAKVGNGAELEQGTYRVEVEKNGDSAEVLFFQGGELVETAPARLTKEAMKCPNTEIHSAEVNGARVITKIWLQGWKESLVFKLETPEVE